MNNKYQSNHIKCLIIDDDPFIQDLLKDKLEHHFKEIHVLEVCSSGMEGQRSIEHYNPDLVFLDVEMTDMTGFEMLGNLNNVNFKVIFITSYKHYAIKAIRFNALDYLLKPFDLEELRAAIHRYKKQENTQKIPTLIKNLKSKSSSDQTLILNTQNGELFLPLNDIIHIDGERNYSYIHLTHKRKELVSKTLSHLEELLEDKGFFRCHKSHIINKKHIIPSHKQLQVTLSNDLELPIARRKKEAYKNWLNN